MSLQNKKILKIRLEPKIRDYYMDSKNYYSMTSLEQFLEYFLPSQYEYLVLNNNSKNQKADIAIWDIQLQDNAVLKPNELNMLISIEHLNYWTHYNHYNKYGDYGDNKMNIYLYNHITEIKEDTPNKFIAIPMIHNYINYFLKNHLTVKPSEYTEFKDKKFCLMVNKSNLNNELQHYVNLLSTIGTIDNISLYNTYIESKSCYHSTELLNVLNKYKFIICFENSYGNGYITEKIFNCFFARAIPIYKGSPIVTNYFNSDAFISIQNTDDNLLERISLINNDETLYNNIINLDKISDTYNNEDYENRLVSFINQKLRR